MWYVIMIIAGFGAWSLFLAIATIANLIPVLSVIPFAFVRSSIREWKDRHKTKAASDRRRAFEERIEASIRRHEEAFPEANDHDENGIPYL